MSVKTHGNTLQQKPPTSVSRFAAFCNSMASKTTELSTRAFEQLGTLAAVIDENSLHRQASSSDPSAATPSTSVPISHGAEESDKQRTQSSGAEVVTNTKSPADSNAEQYPSQMPPLVPLHSATLAPPPQPRVINIGPPKSSTQMIDFLKYPDPSGHEFSSSLKSTDQEHVDVNSGDTTVPITAKNGAVGVRGPLPGTRQNDATTVMNKVNRLSTTLTPPLYTPVPKEAAQPSNETAATTTTTTTTTTTATISGTISIASGVTPPNVGQSPIKENDGHTRDGDTSGRTSSGTDTAVTNNSAASVPQNADFDNPKDLRSNRETGRILAAQTIATVTSAAAAAASQRSPQQPTSTTGNRQPNVTPNTVHARGASQNTGSFAVANIVRRQRRSTYKMSVIGDSGIGKTCMIAAMMGYEYSAARKATVGMACETLEITFNDGFTVAMEIYDTAGSERYNSLASGYLRMMDIVAIAYDSRKPSYTADISAWSSLVDSSCRARKVTKILVRTKCDAASDKDYDEKGRQLAEQIGAATYFATSAMKRTNIDTMTQFCASMARTTAGVLPVWTALGTDDQKMSQATVPIQYGDASALSYPALSSHPHAALVLPEDDGDFVDITHSAYYTVDKRGNSIITLSQDKHDRPGESERAATKKNSCC
jgi:small GTP-binding protein